MRVPESLRRSVRYNYLRLLRLRIPARTMAMGLAVGVFAGCIPALPPIPMQVLFAVVLAFVFRGSKVAALIAINHSNPLNWWLFWIAQYHIGKHLVPFNVHFDTAMLSMDKLADINLLELGWQMIATMYAGGVAMGVPLGVASYFIALPLIRSYRKRRTLRMLERKARLSQH